MDEVIEAIQEALMIPIHFAVMMFECAIIHFFE